MAHNEAHNALVREALQELAIKGYTAWRSESGAWIEDSGRVHKFGKKGGGDITLIVPRKLIDLNGDWIIIGQHVEAEAKTGTGAQSKNQKLHQEHVVEKNGGVYILFRSVDELLCQLQKIK